MPDVTHPPPGTAAAPETAAQPAARNIPQAVTPVTIPEDGEEINLRLSAAKQALLKDYCYRFVKDGRHLTPNRLCHFGQLREVVEEVPALKGWAVRVPRNMERERFERHFACGRYAQSRQAPEYTYLSNIASSLSSMENIVQRGFTPIAVPPVSASESQTRVELPTDRPFQNLLLRKKTEILGVVDQPLHRSRIWSEPKPKLSRR